MAGPGQHHQIMGRVQGVDIDDQQAMASGLIGTFAAMPLTASGCPAQVPSNHAARLLGDSPVTASAQPGPPCPPSDAEDCSLSTPSALPDSQSVPLQGRPPQGTQYDYPSPMAEAPALLDLPVDDPFTWTPSSSSPTTSPSAFLGSPGDSHPSFSRVTLPPSPSDPDNHVLTPPKSPSEPWFSARTARRLFTQGKTSSAGLWPAQADWLETYLEDEQTNKYQDLISRCGGKGKMGPMAFPFEPLQVYLGQIPPDPGSDRPDHAANNTGSVPRTPSPEMDEKRGEGKRKRLASSPATPENGSGTGNGNDADRHVHKGKGRAARAASVEELPRTPSSQNAGKKRAISISSGDEPAPSTRLDKGKGRALPAFHPDGDESFAEHFARAGPLEFLEPGVVAGILNSSPHKGSSFRSELLAAGDVGTSTSNPARQPHVEPARQPSPPAARYFVGQPSAGEPSGYNTATSCSRDRSPAYTGGDAPSAGSAAGGYTTVYLHDTTVVRDPPVSQAVPATSCASNATTAAAPPIQDTSNDEPLSVGLSLFAPPGKGPFYTPPPGRPPIPMFDFGSQSSPNVGFGSSAAPFVVDDASARCSSPPQQAGLSTDMTASLQPRGRGGDAQLGASSAAPIVIADDPSQTESIVPIVPIDVGTPGPPPDATVSGTRLPCSCSCPCAWCRRRPQAPVADDPGTDATAQPSVLVVNGSRSRDETGSGSQTTRAELTSLAQAALSHNEVPADSSPAPAPVPERTPLEMAIERQRSRALRTKPKYSSPLRFFADAP